MTARTADYLDHMPHLDQVRFRAHIWGGDENDPYLRTHATREFRYGAEAGRWMREKLPKVAKSTTDIVSADIRRGMWVVDSYPDDEFGSILDAAWDDEGMPVAFCFIEDDGSVRIDWEE